MPNRAPHTLQLRGLSVRRGTRVVLDDLSLALGVAEIVALVGPNGAGKTTLLEAALGAVPLAAGDVLIDGSPVRTFAHRARAFAYLAGESEPHPEIRVSDLVRAASARSEPAWAAELRERLGIDALSTALAGALSRGEQRRLLLFETLASTKPFVLLDEPTGVFDPVQLLDVVDVLRTAAQRGTGLLLSVHQMSDAEALASRVLILNRGRKLALGTMPELRELAGTGADASLQNVFLKLLHAQRVQPGDPHALA